MNGAVLDRDLYGLESSSIFFYGFVLWVAPTLLLARDVVRVSIYGAYPSRQSRPPSADAVARCEISLRAATSNSSQVGR